jgi:hypothetical protein
MTAMLRNRKVSAFPVADENGAVIGVACEAGRLAAQAPPDGG